MLYRSVLNHYKCILGQVQCITFPGHCPMEGLSHFESEYNDITGSNLWIFADFLSVSGEFFFYLFALPDKQNKRTLKMLIWALETWYGDFVIIELAFYTLNNELINW